MQQMKNLNQNIARCFFMLITLVIFGCNPAQAQEEKEKFFQKHKFVNMTEFGGLFGRIKYQTYYYGRYPVNYPTNYQVSKRINVSFQTFNGVQLDKKTSAGLTLGIDAYGETILMPVALGIRRALVQKREGGSSLMAGLDAGYSTVWLNEDNTGFKTSGGLMACPTIGYRLPMRNGSAWLINLGYRFQQASYKEERQGDGVYWTESKEERKYKRMVVRLGIEF